MPQGCQAESLDPGSDHFHWCSRPKGAVGMSVQLLCLVPRLSAKPDSDLDYVYLLMRLRFAPSGTEE